MFLHPELNTKQFPKDPAIVLQAITRSLNPESTRDVRYLKSLLSRMPKVHTRLKRHYIRFKTLIAAPEWDLVPIDDAFSDRARAAKQRIRHIVPQLFNQFLDGVLFGESLTEIEPFQSSIGWKFKILKNYHPTELERNERFNRGLAILETNSEDRSFQRLEIPESDDFRFVSFVNFDTDEPGGILRDVLFPVFLLNLMEQEWVQFLQFMKGIISARYKQGSQPAEISAAEKAVESAVEYKFATISENINFDWQRLTEASSGKNFQDFADYFSENIEIAITGTSGLATDRERNAQTVQERDAQDIAIWGRRNLEVYFNEQLLKYDYYLNESPQNPDFELPYDFKFMPKLTGDKEANMRIIESAAELGIPIKLKEFTKLTGVPHAGNDDDLISTIDSINPPFDPDPQDLIEGGQDSGQDSGQEEDPIG